MSAVRRLVSLAAVVAVAGMTAVPAAHADTVVGCDTGGLLGAISAANTAGKGTLDLTAGCRYALTYPGPDNFGLLVSGNIRIHGNGATIERLASAPPFGLVDVSGTLTADHLTLTGANDVSDLGGGVLNNGTLTLDETTVADNVVASSGSGGGGIYNNGTLVLTNSSVSGNSVRLYNGGGILNNGTATLIATTVSDNTAAAGGGISDPDSEKLTLVNSTVSGNTANFGGGIYHSSGILRMTSSTISGNAADGVRGGGGLVAEASVAMTNSIISDNHEGNCDADTGALTTGNYDVDSDGSCGFDATTDLNNVDPLLGPLQSNGGPTATMAPSPTSPVVDAIPKGASGCGTKIAVDQRGVMRPKGTGCDIGAYETGDIAVQSLVAAPASVKRKANTTLTATVVNAGAADATGVTVTDTLPIGLTFVSAHTSDGTCVFTSPKITCALFDQFAAAATTTVALMVKVTAAAGTKITDTATVGAKSGDPTSTNDTKTAVITVT